MARKILICLHGNEVTPRFDLATEVLIAFVGDDGKVQGEKVVVLPKASAEMICHMVLTESIQVVICGGIEEEYYQYLSWKRVQVLDSVIGNYREALERYAEGRLQAGDVVGAHES
ncbi:MAG TPA: dinitrogenase iron-molybdenum cofactor biosynthesis protein [Syntrophobacteraceae bacterium]|jgi:predicted Fe-Mo cluster-binding NifX family protein|nr:dinitrogenase iron-molybdenum cofactor biosynthesis protein [Syntrophobacteraceae bacterium]HBD10080.1 dinitrogenase iron-molybdenum cofactor biosynthesis protein [Syntrophobacteraceae bacterium]HBZ55770.1 dinitrogenase iron-molybdenum cofactor biosynthesis protein [Syntrophobacteraceae bacterium]